MTISRSTKQRAAQRRARQRRQEKLMTIIIVGVLSVIIGGVLILVSWRSGQADIAAAEAAAMSATTSFQPSYADFPQGVDPFGAPAIGSQSAPVLLEVYSDFSCGHCANFSQTVDQLIVTYVADGTLRVVFKPMTFVFPPYSETAAIAALCSEGQDRFWEMHDALFEIYQTTPEGPQNYTSSRMLSVANALGLDVDAFSTCMASPEPQAALNTIREEAAARGVAATPIIFVNNQRVQDRSFEGLSQLIESLR